MKIKWVKVLDDGGGSSLELVQRLLAVDIMPIVRLYRMEPNPGTIGGREEDTIRRLVAAGVRYFETNNEPDLAVEWKGGQVPPNWLDIVVDNFIVDADKVLGLGGLPALPAMAVGSKANAIDLVVKRGRGGPLRRRARGSPSTTTPSTTRSTIRTTRSTRKASRSARRSTIALGPWAWERRLARSDQPVARVRQESGRHDRRRCLLLPRLPAGRPAWPRAALGFPVPIISTEGGPVVGWKEDRRYPRVTPDLHRDRVSAITEFMQGTREIHGENCPTTTSPCATG